MSEKKQEDVEYRGGSIVGIKPMTFPNAKDPNKSHNVINVTIADISAAKQGNEKPLMQVTFWNDDAKAVEDHLKDRRYIQVKVSGVKMDTFTNKAGDEVDIEKSNAKALYLFKDIKAESTFEIIPNPKWDNKPYLEKDGKFQVNADFTYYKNNGLDAKVDEEHKKTAVFTIEEKAIIDRVKAVSEKGSGHTFTTLKDIKLKGIVASNGKVYHYGNKLEGALKVNQKAQKATKKDTVKATEKATGKEKPKAKKAQPSM